MKNLKEAFGNNLKRIRTEHKLTLEALSELLEITPRQLAKIESGETFLTAETLSKISIVLDVSLVTLFDFDWHDKLLYMDGDKFIKHHFKITRKGDVTKIKSLPTLCGFNINTTMPRGEVPPFLIKFAQKNNMVIFADFFINKKREQVFKAYPDGRFICWLDDKKDEALRQISQPENDYYYILEKFKRISNNQLATKYIRTALDALENPNSLEELKAIIRGLELSSIK